MDVAVVLDPEPLRGVIEVDAADEVAPLVGEVRLDHRTREPGEHEQHP